MFRKLLVVLVLVLIGGGVSFAQKKKAKIKVDGGRLITAMARSKNMPPVVGDNGVFVNTLLDGDGLPPEVRRILDLKKDAIPLLIEHLDDMRETRMSYCCDSENTTFTVGDACLNMLKTIVEPSAPMFDEQCVAEEDDQSFCLGEAYEFSLSSYTRRGKRRAPRAEVVAAKRKWFEAYRENRIKFKGY